MVCQSSGFTEDAWDEHAVAGNGRPVDLPELEDFG
jgi:hypothetical protein